MRYKLIPMTYPHEMEFAIYDAEHLLSKYLSNELEAGYIVNTLNEQDAVISVAQKGKQNLEDELNRTKIELSLAQEFIQRQHSDKMFAIWLDVKRGIK